MSSQLGLEAIFAGHRPQVFGAPFYAGWGLSEDRTTPARRGRRLTKAQLFAATYLLAPHWFNPFLRRLCSFEEMVDVLEAALRAQREDRAGYVAVGMRAWKRGRLQAVFGAHKPIVFMSNFKRAAQRCQKTGARLMVWGAADVAHGAPVLRIEDGLLRSRGLGAALTPPLSLIVDDLGIYYDPARPSRLESLMMQPQSGDARARAEVLIEGLCASRLSKYNLQVSAPDLPAAASQARVRVLVPGQVEDDASVRLGAGVNEKGQTRSNLDLLRAARAAYPRAFIIYKPHPDVEAGLRKGSVTVQELGALADFVAMRADPIAMLDQVDVVFTLTSTLGFEALLHGKKVICLGAPFYAGWGLTDDLGDVPIRRRDYCKSLDQRGHPAIDLFHLAYAALIAYPRYFDPITRQPCPPEVVLHRLVEARAKGGAMPQGLTLRLLSKLQGRFASFAHWWR